MGSAKSETSLNGHQEAGDVVDGIHRFPATGIKALVVGCGPAGLFAALELWRKGNDVTVLEQTAHFSPAGDFFTITPSGLSTMKYYPTMRAEHEANANDAPIRFSTSDYRLIFEHEPEWKICPGGHAAGDVKTSMLNPRFQFQKMIKDQCSRVGIKFIFSAKVVEYQENDHEAAVLLADGRRLAADLVVASDGIATKSNVLTRGGEVQFQSTGFASAQCGFPLSDIDPNSKAAHLLPRDGERPHFDVFLNPRGEDLILLFIPGYVGFHLTHRDDGEIARENWTPKVDTQGIIDKYMKKDEWDERILDLARQIKVPMVDWCLTWRNPHREWTSPGGRVVQTGDAAHPFLPTSGNGATQSIEDAISLAECIRLGGKESLTLSTKVHNLLRFKRVSLIQRTGFVNRNHLEVFQTKSLSGFVDPMNWGKWNWTHKPEVYVQDRFTEAMACVRQNTESQFEDTNLPPGFKWDEWTMEEELQRIREKRQNYLKKNGYWGWK